MKLIEQSHGILEQKPGLEGIYEAIETAARTCYKSTRKEGTTAKNFVDRMIASKHYAMLEHGTVYLKLTVNADMLDKFVTEFSQFYWYNPYSARNIRYYTNSRGTNMVSYYITTNYRVLVENNRLDDLQYLCEPTEHHKKRVTVRFICSIGIGRELTRHRVFSFVQESSRYCNYSTDKFNNEITFIKPSWIKETMNIKEANNYWTFKSALSQAESYYLQMISYGAKPEEARDILPLATKSELVMTGFVSDWKNVFDLRVRGTTGKPHPDCKALIEPLMQEFIDREYI